ncbi:MAG: toxin-activating lysine-acyltransferase [Hyphomicrobiaceae bacterium]|nr:toxin-activating lysine-acyltransferase [Hyphomicrobiaceae bacterium]
MPAARKTSAKTKAQPRRKTASARTAKKPSARKARKKADAGNGEGQQAAARQALQAKMVAAGFGEVVSVLMRSPHYKHYSLTDLEWLVVPPLLANQFTLAEARTKEGGIPAPVGVALWACVSDEVDKKLTENIDRPVRLRPDEWTSGDTLWLIDAVGAPEAVKAMVERMGEAVFEGRPFKLRARGNDGKVSVQTVGRK